jgi:hypothetical protein
MLGRVDWVQDMELTAKHLGDVGHQIFLGALGMWCIAYAQPGLLLLGGGVVLFLVTIHCHANVRYIIASHVLSFAAWIAG